MDKYKQIDSIDGLMGIIKLLKHSTEQALLILVDESFDIADAKVKELLDVNDCNLLLTVCEGENFIEVKCKSYNKSIRALELMDFIFKEYGMLNGDECEAVGHISTVILNVKASNMELGSSLDFFGMMLDSYYREVAIIYPSEYVDSNEGILDTFSRYVKKQIPWAYVKTTDIADEGKLVTVKTLENDTGVTITVGPDAYIMIGCQGEVYDIKKDKFDKSYETSLDKLDIFSQMLEFIPAVEVEPEGTYVTIDEMAHLCYPSKQHGIYAKKLDRRTKVFMSDTPEDYFVGNKGDYLAIRCDDVHDVYIIKNDIFLYTYEKTN